MSECKTVLARNIILMEAAGKVCAAARESGIPVILLKGAALLQQGVYGLHERQMTDIDLLVRPCDIGAFEGLLSGFGYKPMENSSQAWYKLASLNAPPLTIDVHTGLWHVSDTGALWEAAEGTRAGEGVPVLNLPDQFLHAASHALLYHGCLENRIIADLARLLQYTYRVSARARFWLQAASLSDTYRLDPVVYPVLKRLAEAWPGLVGAGELLLLEPRGFGKVKSVFFEGAARKHSSFLEYLLPILYRPELLMSGFFPGGKFLARRYGKDSWFNHFKRPFQLLFSVFRPGP